MKKIFFLLLLTGCAPAVEENVPENFRSTIKVSKTNGKVECLSISFPSSSSIYNLDDLSLLEKQLQSMQKDIDFIKQQMLIDENFRESPTQINALEIIP